MSLAEDEINSIPYPGSCALAVFCKVMTLGNREVQCPLWPAYALSQEVGGDSKCCLSFVAAQAYIRWKLLWSV